MPNNNFPVDYKDIPSCEPCKTGRFDENKIATNKLNILSQLSLMLPDKWYQTLKFVFSDLIYCILILFFVVMPSVAMINCLQTIFKGKYG